MALHISEEKCSGCGRCVECCPTDVLQIEDQVAVVAYADQCMECGLCETECLEKAVRIT